MKKFIIAVSALAAAACIAGCTQKTATQNDAQTAVVKTTSDQYPLETDTTLTYWCALNSNISAYASSLGETEFAKYVQEETGVKLDFIHPAANQQTEKFNLMVASMDLPDIIEYKWLTYSGGPQKAIDSGIILPLNDYIEAGIVPNLEKTLNEREDVKKLVQTNEGNFFCFPFIYGYESLQTSTGFIIREDLLDKAGLDMPVTREDWETTLQAFKEMGIASPISLRLTTQHVKTVSPFTSFFGFITDFYIEDGKVKCGWYEPVYKDYIEMMKQWYDNDWLDKEFSNSDTKRISAGVINGEIGATFCMAGSEYGNWYTQFAATNPSGKLSPVQYPSLSADKTPMYGQKSLPVAENGMAAVTASCKNPEIAMRFLDYGYSEAGDRLYNFGREGESFEFESGKPVYKPELFDGEKNGGLSASQALSNYMRSVDSGPFVQNPEYRRQYMSEEHLQNAIRLWSDTDALSIKLPYLYLDENESKTYSKLMADIETYTIEKMYKFIMGKESLDDFDSYLEELKAMGIEEVIELEQNAYDAYLSKK